MSESSTFGAMRRSSSRSVGVRQFSQTNSVSPLATGESAASCSSNFVTAPQLRPRRHHDVTIPRAMRRVAGGEDQPLQLAVRKKHPRCRWKDDPFCIDPVKEASTTCLDDENVAEADQVEAQEGVRMRDTVARNCDSAGLAREARTPVMARSLRQNLSRGSLVESDVFVQPRNRQDTEAGSRRGIRGGSGMQGC